MGTYIIIIYVAIVIIVCIAILFYTETPSKALGYLLLVISFPIGGIILYFSVGLNYRKRELYRKKLEIDELEFPKLEQRVTDQSNETLIKNKEQIGHFYQMASFSRNKNLTSSNNTASLLINGEQKFPDVIESLKQAKHHIHIEYYIYENDVIGNQLAQVLMEKAREGLEVRFIYDDYGCRGIRKNIVKQLREAGVEAYPFYKIHLILLANRLNYRNHRKIIVIDGTIGYVGGINVSDKYINQPGNTLFWRDTHLKITGASVVNLQFVFLADWNFCANQKISFSNDYFPFEIKIQKHGNHLVQIVSSGPDSKYPQIKYTLIQAILMARSEVCITTPYFIPDKSFLEAVNIATLSGVKVKVLLPGVADSSIINTTTRSYFQGLLEAGVEIYTYTKGFVHAKTMVCDQMVAIVGTANLDNRSFDLNFEINAIIFDEEIAGKLRSIFEKDLSHSTQIILKEWEERPFYKKFVERVLHLFSSLM
ncbi:MAG: cardiolipin synthase [Lentimicrobium sp.]|jgi:cardiolipin synthase|nr:cardiolipin synthase [Lentimicrobium sp.]